MSNEEILAFAKSINYAPVFIFLPDEQIAFGVPPPGEPKSEQARLVNWQQALLHCSEEARTELVARIARHQARIQAEQHS